jgi:PAS domain S-box-containing protein
MNKTNKEKSKGSVGGSIAGSKRAEENLWQSEEEHYRLLVDRSPAIIAVHSAAPECKWIYTNAAGARLLGAAKPEEIIGKRVLDFIHPNYHEFIKRRWRRTQVEKKRTEPAEIKMVRLDGEIIDVETMGIPTTYEGCPATQTFILDISDRKRAEEVRRQRDFYETLLQAQSDVGEGLLVIEGERIVYANDAFCLMSGYGVAELMALPTFLELAAPDQWPVLHHRMHRRLRGEAVEECYETAILHRSGRQINLELGVRLLRREAQFPHLVVVARDITERKRAEEKLHESEANLQRSRERLVAAREEERRRLRRDLHDGLGPRLASLMMRAEAAHDLVSLDPTRAQEVLEGLAKQAQAAVAEVRRLVYALRPPALDALGLMGALRSQAVHHDHNGLHLTIDGPEELPVLPAAVEVAAYRIALEALTNIVCHAEARNCVIRLELHEKTGTLRLEVEDDGRGIGENRPAGVGLISMRERAEELGGSCTVEAIPSSGTRVRVSLPHVQTCS